MQNKFLQSTLVLALLVTSFAPSQAKEHTFLNETAEARDARMQWWRDAKFGMFIHWGPYAIPAGKYKDQQIKGIGEWIMARAKIPISEYEQFSRNFNPQLFDAKQWVKIAADAGMKYIVITTKHHDGFCLWDSEVTDYDIIDFTQFDRDIIGELTEACNEAGLKMCFYYSILDWHHPDAQAYHEPEYIKNHTKRTSPNWSRYADSYMRPQLAELIKNYDPAVLWFDGEWIGDWTEPQGKALYNELRGMKPSLIINNRVGKGRKGMQGFSKDDTYAGDFGTPEQEIPDRGFPGVDWESCMTMNNTWGFKTNDHRWKSNKKLIHNLVDIASKGGNFLLNIGPKADGTIPTPSVKRLAAMGRWMKINSESIYGTQASPYSKPEWGRYTSKPGKLYVHVFDWPTSGKLTIEDPELKAKRVYLLADPTSDLKTSSGDAGLTIELPAEATDEIASVVVVELE